MYYNLEIKLYNSSRSFPIAHEVLLKFLNVPEYFNLFRFLCCFFCHLFIGNCFFTVY